MMPGLDPDTVEAMEEAAAKIAEAFRAILDAISESCYAISETFEGFLRTVVEAEEKAAKLRKERLAWKRSVNTKIRPLMLDRRSRVHRCRNAI